MRRERKLRILFQALGLSLVRRMAPLVFASGVLLIGPVDAGVSAPTTPTVVPPLYKNCTNFHKRYPHGVGRRLARDKTSGTPVRTFLRSTLIYNRAMRYNSGLDRDKDGIACEKK
jgi:Excalibur calcium-binding domain